MHLLDKEFSLQLTLLYQIFLPALTAQAIEKVHTRLKKNQRKKQNAVFESQNFKDIIYI